MGDSSDQSQHYELLTKYFDQYFYKTDNFSLIKLMVYTPIGIMFVVLRCVILSLFILFVNFFPKIKHNGYFIRLICMILGIHTKCEKPLKNNNSNESLKVFVSNHITCFDYLPIKLLINNSKYFEDTIMNRNLSPKHASNDFISMNIKKVLQVETPKDTDNLYLNKNEYPLICFPELMATNGNYGVLKFDTKPFNLNKLNDSKSQEKLKIVVVPVALKAYRPIISLSLNWLGSNDLINVFFMLFTPFTIYKVKFFEEEALKENETNEELADRVQSTISKGLDICCSNLNHENIRNMWIEYEKNQQELLEQQEQARNTNNNQNRDTYLSEINRITLQVRNILPDTTLEIIREHMAITSSNDVDTIITSILDSNVTTDSHGPARLAVPASTSSNVQKPMKKSPATFKSYEDRKLNLINEARKRFLAKDSNRISN